MPDSTVNIIHELTFQVNEASVQKVDETFANITRSLQALNANTNQVSRNLNSLIDSLNKGTKAANAYAQSLNSATAAANKFAAANANVGNLVGAAIGKMNAGISAAITQMNNLQTSMLVGLTNSTKRIQALEAEARAAAKATAAVSQLQSAYNNLRPPAGGGTPTPPPGGGGGFGGGIGSRFNLGPMGGSNSGNTLFGVDTGYLLRRFTSGYIVGAGFRAFNATFDAITNFVGESGELASKVEGVTKAFQRLGDPGLLAGLRDATAGTVSDLDLMTKAVNAVNLGLPVQQLGKAFEFARIRARETGQDVDYLVNSIVLGIGRKSPLILDNLGINALRVRERFKELGDFTQAAFEIINEEIQKSGQYVDTYADRSDRLSASLKNQQAALGEATNAVMDYSKAFLTDIYEIIFTTGKVVENIENLRKARQALAEDKEVSAEAETFVNRVYQKSFQTLEDRLKEADPQARDVIRKEAEDLANRLKAIEDAREGLTDREHSVRLRAIASAHQRFERSFSETKGSIEGLTADMLRAAAQSPKTAFSRTQLQDVRDAITLERTLLDVTDTARIKQLAGLDKEAKRQQDLIDATEKKTHKDRVQASAELDLQRRIDKALEDIAQAREARSPQSPEKIEALRAAEVKRAQDDLTALEKDLQRRRIWTDTAKAQVATLRELYAELARIRALNETEAMIDKRSTDRQNALNAAVESTRNLRARQTAGGRVFAIDEIRAQVAEERRAALAAEHLYHQQQMRALEGQDAALEYENKRHLDKMEDMRLDFIRRDLNAVEQYYNQLRVELNRQAAFETTMLLAPFTQEQREVNEGPDNIFVDRNRRLRLIRLRREMVAAQKQFETAQREEGLAQGRLQATGGGVFGLPGVGPRVQTPLSGTDQLREFEDAAQGFADAQQKTADAQTKATKTHEEYMAALRENIPKIIDMYNAMANAVSQAYNQITQAQSQQLNSEIQIREERLRQAERFAERGNTAYLRQEQQRLDQSYKQQRTAATQQIAINTTLAASQAALGAVKAAVSGTEGGPFLIAANVIAFLAAIAGGIISATNTANSTMPSVQFWKGGFTGEGDKFEPAGVVHKGEFVSNQETTRRHRKVLEAMHDGTFDDKYVRVDQAQLSLMDMPLSKQNKQILGKLDSLVEAVEGNKINVRQSMDARGLTQVVEQIKKQGRTRFSG